MPLLDVLLSTLAPHHCIVCGAEGRLVCAWCAPDAFPELPSRCYRCQKLSSDSAVCNTCRKQTALRHVWIRTDYSVAAKELLRLYKFERTRAAANIIAHAMEEMLPYLSDDIIVIAVPTATSRVRQRGYDHAALLARAIAGKRKLLWVPALANLAQTRQVGANRQKRLEQLEDNFLVTKPEIIKGSHILLIDDVLTTGATLETAAKALKQAGAKTVDALIFAQRQ
ncbi:MAG: phosphoribosyltransferase family protein [Patescibacteria group bacterium]